MESKRLAEQHGGPEGGRIDQTAIFFSQLPAVLTFLWTAQQQPGSDAMSGCLRACWKVLT